MGVDLILGNDLAGGKVSADPCVTHIPLCHDESEDTTIYTACAVPRAMARAKEDNASGPSPETTTSRDNPDEIGNYVREVSRDCDTDSFINLSDMFMNHDTSADRVGDEDHIPSPEPSGRSHEDFV